MTIGTVPAVALLPPSIGTGSVCIVPSPKRVVTVPRRAAETRSVVLSGGHFK